MTTELISMPNIGLTLARKLHSIGITTPAELMEAGSENAIIRLATLENSGVCINMLYALEGAVQGIRWHGLAPERKEELRQFFSQLK